MRHDTVPVSQSIITAVMFMLEFDIRTNVRIAFEAKGDIPSAFLVSRRLLRLRLAVSITKRASGLEEIQ